MYEERLQALSQEVEQKDALEDKIEVRSIARTAAVALTPRAPCTSGFGTDSGSQSYCIGAVQPLGVPTAPAVSQAGASSEGRAVRRDRVAGLAGVGTCAASV